MSTWLLYAQVLALGAILVRQVLRPFSRKRRAARAERMAAQILRESRDARKQPGTPGREGSQAGV